MKKAMTLVLAAALFALVCGAAFAQKESDFRVERSKDGTVTITDYRGNAKKITIPSTINGITITSIDSLSSSKAPRFTSVVIPDTVVEIRRGAFANNSYLKTVTFGKGLKIIGDQAFYNCYSLEQVNNFDSLAGGLQLGKDVFKNTPIESKMADIMAMAALKGEVTEDDFEIEQTAQGTILITGYTGRAVRVVIPATISGIKVAGIKQGAFRNNKTIRIVVIPNVITDIPDSAFYGCGALESVELPPTLKTIGASAFSGCKLASLTIPNGVTSIGAETFSGNAMKDLIIPDSVTTLGDKAFSSCGLQSLKLGKGLTTIASGAFRNNKLTDFTIPPSVRTVGREAFRGNQITTLVVSNGVTLLYSEAFESNPIANLTIPPSLAQFDYDRWDTSEGERIPAKGASPSKGFQMAFDRRSSSSVTNITLPANTSEENLFGFDESFINFWKSQGKKAGTYIKNGRVWTVQ